MRKSGNTSKRPAPFSLRLSFEERAELERRADGEALGTYIRAKLFGKSIRDGFSKRSCGKLLGELGQSGVSSSLLELSEAVRSGSLPVSPETEAAILQACENVQDMRLDLVRALGLKPR